MKLLIIITILALVFSLFFLGNTNYRQEHSTEQITIEATVADIEVAVLARGKVNPKQVVRLGAQVSGQIQAMHVSLGDSVKKGQLIAEIDAKPQLNAITNAELAIKNLSALKKERIASQKQARLSFERHKQLADIGISPLDTYGQAEAALAKANAEIDVIDVQIKQAIINLDSAKLNLSYTKISSPIDGVVTNVGIKLGQTVNTNQLVPTVAVVAQLNVMTVTAQVSEVDVTKIRPGQKVYFSTLGDSNQRYFSTIEKIAPAPESFISDSVSNSAIYYRVFFDAANTNRKLFSSMTANVHIVVAEAKNVVVIPSLALVDVNEDGTNSVNIINEEGVTITRNVSIGVQNDTMAEVVSGLSAGDKVIILEHNDTHINEGQMSW